MSIPEMLRSSVRPNGSAGARQQMPMPIPPRPEPKTLHPAAAQAMAEYSDTLDKLEEIRSDRDQLAQDLRVANHHIDMLTSRLQNIENQCERYRRYAVSMQANMATASQTILSAMEAAKEFALNVGPGDARAVTRDDLLRSMEQQLQGEQHPHSEDSNPTT